ncbi:MAG: hypothetical protein ACYCZN_11300 [Candidatus Dormibacteria bacterium]
MSAPGRDPGPEYVGVVSRAAVRERAVLAQSTGQVKALPAGPRRRGPPRPHPHRRPGVKAATGRFGEMVTASDQLLGSHPVRADLLAGGTFP